MGQNVNSGDLISLGHTNVTNINLADLPQQLHPFPVQHCILVITGTLQVGIGGISGTKHPFPAGSRIPISCFLGDLYVKQGAAGDTWTVTA
jgi:hypothetical protein